MVFKLQIKSKGFIIIKMNGAVSVGKWNTKMCRYLLAQLKDCNTLVRMCDILIFGLANRFSSFR